MKTKTLLLATALLAAACGAESATSSLDEVANPPLRADQESRIRDATVKAASALGNALLAYDRQGERIVTDALLADTRCVVAMRITRGAFLLGGEGGEGVMACRLPFGGWSAPSYVRTGGFELSAAIGFDSMDVAMFITSESLAEDYKSQANFDTRAYASAVAASASAALNAAGRYGMAVVQTNNQGLFAGVGITFSSMSHMQARRNQHVYQDVLGGGTPVDLQGRLCSSYVLPARRNACIAGYEQRTGRPQVDVTSHMILTLPAEDAPLITRPFNDQLRRVL